MEHESGRLWHCSWKVIIWIHKEECEELMAHWELLSISGLRDALTRGAGGGWPRLDGAGQRMLATGL